ncbi:HtaA domain-containing protein [Microbacterium sp. BLY]|uniref:HtaA domain-containing protein n=1 Tax=Microbacterium sp. BLY TaxID=2823280 RepID=UPI001B33B093|nr:HtaA domain-containing protein [Microbacterium sp. BLY]MBP3977255.1 HtaA domain-containing protein [Microbacterium sp. BLY]
MNATAHTPTASTRLRVLLAALVSFVLVAAGAMTAPPARAAGASVTATVSAAAPTGLTVSVQATGLPDVTGVYAALIVTGTESGVSAGGGYAAFALPFPTVQQGATTFTLTAPVAALDRTQSYEVVVWQQHSAPTAATIYGRGDVAVTPAQWDTVFGTTSTEPEPGETEPGETEPGETQPGETEPGETEPGETQPGETEPGETQPGETTPAPAAIEVFLADGTTPASGTRLQAGDRIIVKGTGYEPTANVGGRGVPIPAHLPQGTYVVFGNFAETWQPSQGAPSSSRSVGAQAWALAEDVLAQVPTQYQGAIRAQWGDISAEGSFEVALTLKDTPATPGTYGVYTYAAGGVANPEQERRVALDYRIPSALTTTVKAATAEDGLTVTATASKLGAVSGAYVALIEKGTEADVTAGGGFLAMQYVRNITGGGFAVDLTAEASALDRSKTYEVIVWQQHTMPNASTIHARSTVAITDAEWNALLPSPGPTVTTAVVGATAQDGLTVKATAAELGAVAGAYVALIETGTEADVTAGGGFLAMQYVRNIGSGAFTVDLTAAAKDLDRAKTYEVIVWQQHTMPNADTIHARAAVAISDAQWRALRGEKPTEPKPPVTPTPTAPAATVPGGSLRWAISSSFTNYITGPIAQGAISVSGGATRSGSQFQFGQTVGGDYDAKSGRGSVVYRGAVRFTGHHGVLDVTVADPVIRITSASSATLLVTSGGTQVPFATLDLSRAVRTAANGAVTYTAAPAALTDTGRDRVLSGYGTALNSVTFTIGSVAAAPSGATGTVAAAMVAPKRTLPATPPAATGIEVDADNLAALTAGEPATVSASGFRPNEEGIQVVVYSTPVLLDTVAADAAGVATWSGSLPATLADGDHTLTFQGSVDRGLAFTLARQTTAIGACTVEGATLHWGYKESFRTYIEGIAKGGWTLSDVTYEYPAFVWANGTGSLDDTARTGLVTYGGALTFTGHDGALNTTLANARVELAGDTGYLVFDVTGTTQAGESIAQQGVRLAEFTLADAAVVDGALVLDALPTTLTAAGAAAFGTYQAGEELDPVSATIPVGAACGTPAEEPEAEADAGAAVTAISAPVVADQAPVWPWIVGGLVVVALAATGGVLLVRRARRDESAETTTEV